MDLESTTLMLQRGSKSCDPTVITQDQVKTRFDDTAIFLPAAPAKVVYEVALVRCPAA